MSNRTARRFLPGFILLLLVMVTGCETGEPDPTGVAVAVPKSDGEAPDPGAFEAQPQNGDFFPLVQGNRWEYARHFQARITPEGGEPESLMIVEAQIESRIAGTETRDGVTYDIMEQHWNEEGDEFFQWVRMRQDGAGLYEAQVPLTDPPMSGMTVRSQASRPERWSSVRRAVEIQVAEKGLDPGFLRALESVQKRHERIMALLSGGAEGSVVAKASRHGGAQANELVRLAYPLHPWASWTMRDDPKGTATVEARELLHLPAGKMPAWRIRLEWDFLQPGDRVLLWYGRCGMLQFEAHIGGEATDLGGQTIGTIVSDESEVLVDLDVQRGGCR